MKLSVVEAYVKSRANSACGVEQARFKKYLAHIDGVKEKANQGEVTCPQEYLIALNQDHVVRSLDLLKESLNRSDYIEAKHLGFDKGA